jgi:hypothetical protein
MATVMSRLTFTQSVSQSRATRITPIPSVFESTYMKQSVHVERRQRVANKTNDRFECNGFNLYGRAVSETALRFRARQRLQFNPLIERHEAALHQRPKEALTWQFRSYVKRIAQRSPGCGLRSFAFDTLPSQFSLRRSSGFKKLKLFQKQAPEWRESSRYLMLWQPLYIRSKRIALSCGPDLMAFPVLVRALDVVARPSSRNSKSKIMFAKSGKKVKQNLRPIRLKAAPSKGCDRVDRIDHRFASENFTL